MSKVIANATMSLDGYIALPDNTIGAQFDWFEAGDIDVPTESADITFHLTPESHAYWRAWTERLGCLIVGRTLFDFTDGWGGRHTMGVPVVVLTHNVPTEWTHWGSEHFHFVTEGIEAAVAKAREVAGDKDVGVAAGTIAAQCLDAGLLDMVAIDLAPVVLGSGKKFFEGSTSENRVFANPTRVVSSDRVIHLEYPVSG